MYRLLAITITLSVAQRLIGPNKFTYDSTAKRFEWILAG